MRKLFLFSRTYFLATLILLTIEIVIAKYVHDDIVRPYLGDVIVVILMYCFLKTFFKISVALAANIALLISFFVETLQYFQIVHKLGLQHSKLFSTAIGNSFEWLDLLMYIAGYLLLLIFEKEFRNKIFD